MPVVINDLKTLLDQSSATENFKQAVQDLQTGRNHPAIQYNRGVPPVKALRAISKLLEDASNEAIDSVVLQGRSGCSDFEGTIQVNGGAMEYAFVWDCAWRAEQEGLRDHWGSPDQIRAAREFGYQCFQQFTRTS
ncbi:MAG: hypothetical protein ACR2IE_06140 [Candidatus Sumerlaeaceae bacterium]